MAGYTWQPVFRQTPENGVQVVTDLTTALSTLKGPHRIGIRYEMDQQRAQDINFRDRSRVNGFRLRIGLKMYVRGDMTEQQHLANIINRMALHGQGWRTELALNAGVEYHDVVLDDWRGPDPAGGKTIAGATFDLATRSVDLLPSIPFIASSIVAIPSGPLYTTLPPASAAWLFHTLPVTGPPGYFATCLPDYAGTPTWVIYVTG